MTTLREIIDAASIQLDQYKYPDVSEAQARLHEILQAAQIGGIAGDKLESIDEYGDTIYIETSYVVRGCADTSSYSFPSSIIDDPDPIRVATLYGLNQRLDKATREVEAAKRGLEYAEQNLTKRNAELTKFNENKGSTL